jgi:bloom syndrome protein
MIQYCENRSDCRRVQVLAYFDEVFKKDACGSQCDNCNSTSRFEAQDYTLYAEQAISLVKRVAADKVTLIQCIDLFRGVDSKKAKDKGHVGHKEFGAGKDLERENVERLFSMLLSEDAIREDNVMNKSGFANQYIILGSRSRDFGNSGQKVIMNVRMTPAKAKAPAKKPKKAKQDAGWKETAGSRSRADMPLSTNVSSPIQAAEKRKTSRKPMRKGQHADEYERDGFVASDPEDDDYNDEDSDAFERMGFAPVRQKGMERVSKRREPGPRIQRDYAMDGLDPTHRDIVEAFVRDAKKMSTKLMVTKGLRSTPFSDTVFRQMAIHFCETAEEMARIPGADPAMVSLYGKAFCKKIAERKQEYFQTLGQQDDDEGDDDLPVDPNAQNVIDLVSDDNEEDTDDYGSLATSDMEDGDIGEPSTYSQQPDKIKNFNAKFRHSQAEPEEPAPFSKPAKQNGGKGGKKSRKPNYQARARQASTAAGGYRPTSGGVRKRTSGGSSGARARTSGGSRAGKAAASYMRGGISMMPT